MERNTIGIDLGASYTKISYRLPLQRSGSNRFAEMESDVIVIDGEVTVPTLVIKTGNPRMPWLLGQEATRVTPGDLEVYENWKSEFYSDAFDAGKVGLIKVASEFFSWLAERLTSCGVRLDSSCRVRVTIPGIERIEAQKTALTECMRLNGWPSDIEIVLEPVANLLGILSSGRNVVSAGGTMNYGRTIGVENSGPHRTLYEAMRDVAMGDRDSTTMALTVIDFGSFTLDASSFNVNLKPYESDRFPTEEVRANSWEVGVIEALDDRGLKELLDNHGVDDRSLPFAIREAAKRALYSGAEFALVTPAITIGRSDNDKECIRRAVDDYCTSAFEAVNEYCDGAELIVITGGGACIPAVRAYFENALRNFEATVVFADPASPRTVEADANTISDWPSTGLGLDRLATCLGTSSVGLGFDPDEACRRFVRV